MCLKQFDLSQTTEIVVIKIVHRVNTVANLLNIPNHLGVEIDLRAEGKDIIIHHDPFQKGELFKDYLKSYSHAFLILNIKTEGIEPQVQEILNKFKVENYFYLDVSQPFMIKYAFNDWSNLAVRVSEFESVESALRLSGKVDWVWVDCFKGFPISLEELKILHNHFKVCWVSPELQKHPKEWIKEFKVLLGDFTPDAVCTKFPDLWD